MRLKFKPNVNVPRGSGGGTSGASEAGGGVKGDAGGGGDAKRRRKRQKSKGGEESAGTEGESSSELETSDNAVKRRQRRTSEKSVSGAEAQSVERESKTTDKCVSQSGREAGQVDDIDTTDKTVNETQVSLTKSTSQLSTTSQLESDRPGHQNEISNEISTREFSSAGQVQSTASGSSTCMRPLGTALARSNTAAVAGGKAVPRIKKKMAPKLVSSRPRKVAPSMVEGEKRDSHESYKGMQAEGDRTVSQARKEVERGGDDLRNKTSEDGASLHRIRTDSDNVCSTSMTSLQTTSESTNRTAVASTLDEVVHHTHSQEPEVVGLSNRSGLIGDVVSGDNLHGNSDTILVTSQQDGDAEIEIRTESADVSENANDLDKSTAAVSSVNLENLTEDSFIYQTCSGDVGRGSQSPRPTRRTGQTSQSASPLSTQEVRTTGQTSQSTSPLSTKEARTTGQTSQSASPLSAMTTDQSSPFSSVATGQTGQSGSPSSAQEAVVTGQTSQSGSPSSAVATGSKRSGSAGQRSKRSVSCTSSVDSEMADDEGEKTSTTKSKSKKGQKRKKKTTDSSSNEPKSKGASHPPSKRQRVSVVKVRDAPDRSTMTMRELIYYNPSANPMSSTLEERKRKKDEGQSVTGDRDSAQPHGGSEANSPVSQERGGEEGEGEKECDDDHDDGRIVPTLKIGVDGKIIIDEDSMLMETSHQDSIEDMGEVVLDSASHTTSSSYRNRYRVTRWTKEETRTFFKALSQVGTDFTMMTLLIPMRSRRELKNKFKREEKSNPQLISQALKRT